MKAPDGGHDLRMLARGESWTSDGQDSMSMQSNSSEWEYGQDCGLPSAGGTRLATTEAVRRRARRGAIGFHAWWCLCEHAVRSNPWLSCVVVPA